MSLLSRKSLAKKLLRTKRFRDGFVSARIAQMLALQARAMREERGLSQTQLATELGTSQNAIYRLENPSFAKSISTLIKVASFFDVGLVVRFERFSGIVDWVSGMDSESILVPSADTDTRLRRAAEGGALDLSRIAARGEPVSRWQLRAPDEDHTPTFYRHQHEDDTAGGGKVRMFQESATLNRESLGGLRNAG